MQKKTANTIFVQSVSFMGTFPIKASWTINM